MLFHFYTSIKILLYNSNLAFLPFGGTNKSSLFLFQAVSPASGLFGSLSPFCLTLHPQTFSFTNPCPCPSNPPTPEVKPYSAINLAAVWPNVHWHTSPQFSLSLTLFASLSGHLSQEACWTDRWKALTFTQNNNKLLTLFNNVTFHLDAMEATSSCLIITLGLPL